MIGEQSRVGVTIGGKYRITRFLAEGGMGTVYEAQHVVVKRRFAVKFLRSEFLHRRDILSRFQLEAESAGALESENVAAAVDFGLTAQGHPYLVMEYLEGASLAAVLAAQGPLPVERAADLVLQACAGMQRAHDAGVIHRDLKPQNLFVCRRSDETDLLKVVDFGVAKLQGGGVSGLTSTGAMVGTPSYMSPEQARGESEIDHRTDVYALGVILYELLSGAVPHPGASHNAVIHHISTQPPLPLARHGRELPGSLVSLVERTLATEPSARPASAAELARELTPFASRRVWPVTSPTTLMLDSTVLAPEHAEKSPSGASAVPLERSTPRAVPRASWRGLSLGLVLLGAVVAVAVLATRKPAGFERPAQPELAVRAELEAKRPLDVHEPAVTPLDVQVPALPEVSPAPSVSPSIAIQPVRPSPASAPRAAAQASLPPAKPGAPSKAADARTTKTVATSSTAVEPSSATPNKVRAEFDQQNPY